MWKQIIIAGTAGVALLGGGAIALAADSPSSTSSSSAPSSSTSSSSAPATGSSSQRSGNRAARIKQALDRVKNFDHAEWVTGPAGSTVTHEAIRGTATAVSATSIQVKSADGTSETFATGSTTKVLLREGGKGSAKKGTVADVKSGDMVVVTGTKAGAVTTATAIVDTGTK